MDIIDKNKNLFTELCINIKQQVDKSLKNLIDYVYDIDKILNNDMENSENRILLVQNYLRDFIEIIEHLTIWLELEIPSYSEGDDFRVIVQNEILDEIATMKANSIASMGQFLDYREQRALASKELYKYSKFDDNYQLISYLDYQFQRNLKLILIEMKSNILRICNILTKNKDLINNRQLSYREHVHNYF